MLKVDPQKGSAQEDVEKPRCSQDRHDEIRKICFTLSGTTSAFHAESVYQDISNYKSLYERWFYSDISNYLFTASVEDNGMFFSNLEKLQDYAYQQLNDARGKDCELEIKQLTVLVDKLWDHSNLAQKQIDSLREGEDGFRDKFEANIVPYTAKFAEDMNKQLISLVSIFTALSFIIFGGISSLDNIFDGAKSIPIVQLVIIGCIWGFCILNLVFTFSFLVSRLTKLSIKSSEAPNATLSQKYPFWVWSNFVILMILSLAFLVYFLDFSGTSYWIVLLSQRHPVTSAIVGVSIIAIAFGIAAYCLQKKRSTDTK